jgi:hypothetical protein
MKQFWRTQGTYMDSFANNSQANKKWFESLSQDRVESQHGSRRKYVWLLSFTFHVLLNEKRLLRPSAQQILDRLQDLDAVYPIDPMVAHCCTVDAGSTTSLLASYKWTPQWPMLDLMIADDSLAHVFLDVDLRIIATNGNLPTLEEGNTTEGTKPDKAHVGHLITSPADLMRIRGVIRQMLESLAIQDRARSDIEPDLTEITDSVFTNCLKHTGFWVDILNVALQSGGLPSIRIVQLSLHTVCFERRSSFQKPFLVMTFDPRQGEVVNDSYREGRDNWTDGFGVVTPIFNGNESAEESNFKQKQLERYQSIEEKISARQKTFFALVSSVKPYCSSILRLILVAQREEKPHKGINPYTALI